MSDNKAAGTVVHAGGDPPSQSVFEIDCNDAPESSKEKFSECEIEEICVKIERLNAAANNRELKRPSKSVYKKNRKAGNDLCKQMNGFARRQSDNFKSYGGFRHLSEECEEELQEQATKSQYVGFSVDHVVEIQVGGHPTNSSNLRWMSSWPNSWMGSKMRKFDEKQHTSIEGTCCE